MCFFKNIYFVNLIPVVFSDANTLCKMIEAKECLLTSCFGSTKQQKHFLRYSGNTCYNIPDNIFYKALRWLIKIRSFRKRCRLGVDHELVTLPHHQSNKHLLLCFYHRVIFHRHLHFITFTQSFHSPLRKDVRSQI